MDNAEERIRQYLTRDAEEGRLLKTPIEKLTVEERKQRRHIKNQRFAERYGSNVRNFNGN